jgi:hypothetical protein
MNARLTSLRLAFAAASLAAVSVAALLVLPAAAKDAGNRLDAKLVSVNAGPLAACSQDLSDCSAANVVRYFIYVENGNQLANLGAVTRGNVRNAFRVSSVDQQVFVDGVQDHDFDFTYTPPPDPSYAPYSGHWPVTATCPPEGPPCSVVGTPAVIPGEKAAVFYIGWAHGTAEPNGTYVFKFVVHGTFNGTPVDLDVTSPPISMTA